MSLGCDSARALGLAGGSALFALGLAGSLHCAGMCGPLSCMATTGGKGRAPLGAYHLARLASYAALGALIYAVGSPLRLSLPQPWTTLLLALPLLLYAFYPWEAPAWLARWHRQAALLTGAWDPVSRGAALGLLTPLLPCGLLYAAAAYSVVAPNAATAMLWMLAFAGGTFPVLALSQFGWGRFAGGARAVAFRKISAATAALVLVALAFWEH